MNLLVVEDSESIRSLLELVLHPHEVRFALNGAHALEVLRRETLPDLIVSDLEMPVMDGWELRRRIESDPRVRRVPFVVFSSSARPPSSLAVFSKAEVRRLVHFVGELEAVLPIRPAAPSFRRAPRSPRSAS